MTKLIFLRRVQDLSDYMQGISIPPYEYTRTANMYFQSLSIHPSNRDPSPYAAVRSLIASAREYTCVMIRLHAQAEEEESMVRTKPLYVLTPSPYLPLPLLHPGQQRKSPRTAPRMQEVHFLRIPAVHHVSHPPLHIRMIGMAMWDNHHRIVNPRDIPLV